MNFPETLKSFVESQFTYCPQLWIFHSRQSNNRINRRHQRTLTLTYKDYASLFEKLLERDNTFSIPERNIIFSSFCDH